VGWEARCRRGETELPELGGGGAGAGEDGVTVAFDGDSGGGENGGTAVIAEEANGNEGARGE